MTEARLVHQPWPFLPQEIAAPVLLWHGMADRAVPLEQVLPVVAQLRRARLHRLPNAGHVGWMAHEPAILAAVTAPDGDDG